MYGNIPLFGAITRLLSTAALLSVLGGCDDKHIELDGGAAARARQEAANQAAASAAGSDSSQAGTATAGQNANAPDPAALTAAGAGCSNLRETGARGLACLHCTQREAQAQARVLSDILVRSCIRNVAINYLVDGTFGFDEMFLFDEVTKLTSGGRKLHLIIYFANGPAQRRFDSTAIRGFATSIGPGEFRRRIGNDPLLQSRYQDLVDRMVPVMRYAVSRGAALYLVPMLEDNLDEESFEVMASLTAEAISSRIPFEIVRNPCGSACYAGNDSRIPAGFLEEKHLAHDFFSAAGGIVTNDGTEYFSPAAGSAAGAELNLGDLQKMRDRAEAGNAIFILWSAKRQGLSATPNSAPFPLPAERHYDMPGSAEQAELIDFLRG